MAKPPAADLGATTPLVPPLYQSSVYTLPDLDVLDRVTDGTEAGYVYARDGHPNARRLGDRLAELEGADWGLVTASGMAAITAAFLSCLGGSNRVVAGNRLYGRTVQLLSQQLSRFGVHTDFVDVNDPDQVRTALLAPADVLHVETVSNPLLRVPDLPALAEIARAARVLRGAFGNMLCFELDGGRDAVNRFLRQAPGVPFSPSLGSFMTTCSHPASTSHRYVAAAEKQRQGITDGLLRLSVGVEDV